MTSSHRVPAAVWWVVAWHALLLVVLSVVFPVWRSPDEGAHVDMARWAAREVGWPEIGERSISRQVIDSYELVGLVDQSPGTSPPLRAPAPPRPPFHEVAPDEPSATEQQMSQHPPLYYVLVGRVGAALLPSGIAFDTEVTALRLLSALLLVPVPLLTWLAARQVLDERGAVTAAVLTCAVPQLSHIGAGVNNDTLLVLATSALAPLLVRIGRGKGTPRLALAAGALAGVAMLTKGFGLFTPLWLGVAWWVGRRWALRGFALSSVAAFVVGGWWTVRNLVVEGAVQPSGIGYPDAPPGFTVDLGWWVGFFWQRFTDRWWFEPNVVPGGAPPLEQVLSIALGALVAAGFVLLWRRVGRVALVLAVPPVALLGITVAGAFNYYRSVGAPYGIHGRYVFPAIAAVAVLAAAALGRWRRGPLAAVGAAVALQALAAWWALDFYWQGVGAVRAWSPLPWAVVVLALAGLAATTVGLGVSVTAGTRRTPLAGRR